MARTGETTRRRGFTLIELLVVVGIIVILISILLPVAATIRRKSAEADTKSEIGRLVTAINNYFHDWHAYPGPSPEANLVGFGTTTATAPAVGSPFSAPAPGRLIPAAPDVDLTPATPPNLTSTENLVLGLCGGATNDKLGAPGMYYYPYLIITGPLINSPGAFLDQGPQDLNPLLKAKHIVAYIEPKTNELYTDVSGTYSSWTIAHAQGASLNLAVPEFLDRFTNSSEQHGNPILYLRARAGAPGSKSLKQCVDTPIAHTPGQPDQSSQYYSGEIAAYNFNFPSTAYATSQAFFQNPTALDGITPRGKDAFILISAGYDGVYGTSDDIVYAP